MSSSNYLPLLQMMSGGLYLIFLGIMVIVAIVRFQQRATGRCLMLVGAIFAAIFGLTSYVAIYVWNPDDFETMMKVQLATSIAASFSQVIFLIGILLQALRGSSESARIEELEAIIRDRDH